MSRTTLACIVTTVLVALSAASASAQPNFYDPSSWFAPQPRPYCGPRYSPVYPTRPVVQPNVYPNYGGPVNGGSYYRGNYGRNTICPDDICGPSVPRYPVAPMPYRTPAPFYGAHRPELSQDPRLGNMDRRVMPLHYEEDVWPLPRSGRSSRSYETNGTPFYP